MARERRNECAYKVINYLIKKFEEIDKFSCHVDDTDIDENDSINADDNDAHPDSDNTSIVVYRTLTQYIASPDNILDNASENSIKKVETEEQEMSCFVSSERSLLIRLLDVLASESNELLNEQDVRISKYTGHVRLRSTVKQQLLKTYEQILWQGIGILCEHNLLWWMDCSLGRKNQLISQKFSAWLKQFCSAGNIHELIQPTIQSLNDSLCCYITSTSWDDLFGQALILAKFQHSRHKTQDIGLGTKTGHLFSDLLYDTVFLINGCEGSNWTIEDIENWPIVEQIPLLHRLDHSIHMARVWAIGRAKHLTNCWNMEQFFRITHVDINALLYALNQLKLIQNIQLRQQNENSNIIVCIKMRTKLISEINVNVEKLKDIPSQSLSILASVCKITSLAYLRICFPDTSFWQKQLDDVPKQSSDYVELYLDEILKPVLFASQNLPLPIQKSISKLILEILCEAWLDHIYKFKIKFSEWGAMQLLVDFSAVPVWIQKNTEISNDISQFLISDESLRRCEGVGRLLLRQPGETVVMKSTAEIEKSGLDTESEKLMPPEMYVPNQKKWLELRLNQQKSSIKICC